MQGTETNLDKLILGMQGGLCTTILDNLSVCAIVQSDSIRITTIDRNDGRRTLWSNNVCTSSTILKQR